MSRQKREESPTGYYHVMQRGVGKQLIFEDGKDYNRYIDKLAECKENFDVKLVAYCLMNNHTHLLLYAKNIKDLAHMMQALGVSYAAYYNIKYCHSGHVFQDRFRSESISDERYLYECIRYIHNNPCKAGVGSREEYKWSSYSEYLRGDGITDKDEVMRYFGNIQNFLVFSKGRDEREFMDETIDGEKLQKGQSIINEELGYEYNNGFIVKRFSKQERDKVLHRLKIEGYSIKEIELLTGVSKRIVERA